MRFNFGTKFNRMELMNERALPDQSQHFVPQSFLRGFTENDNGWFHELDLATNRIQHRHIGKACCVNNFYDINNKQILKDHGIDDPRYLESSFHYENKLRKILNQIRRHENYLLLKEFQIIVEAYVGIKHRSRYYRKKVADKNLISESFDTVSGEFKQQIGGLLAYYPAFNYDQFTMKLKNQILEDENHPTDTHLNGMVESTRGLNSPVQDAINKISSMNISIFEIKSDDYFIVSDNPGYSLNGNHMHNTNYGWFDAIHFPINSKQMIALRNFDGRNYIRPLIKLNYYKLPAKEVSEINRMTTLIADEKLFCESRDYIKQYRRI